MNNEGKEHFSFFTMDIFFLLLCLSFVPYADLFKEENITRLVGGEDFPEKLVVFMACAAFFACLVVISIFVSGILTLLLHLGSRLLFLFELRKPMLIYTGDPNYKSPDCDRFGKLDKVITSLKGYFNSKRLEDFETYFLLVFCFIMLICICFADWGAVL